MHDRIVFHTTKWTRVLAAKGSSPEAKLALGELCESYYEPVMAFIEYSLPYHEKRNERARELSHEFFGRLLEADRMQALEREKGRFRSYLLGAVKHFLSDHADKSKAEIRGGKHRQIEIEDNLIDENSFPPDAFFDRQWGLALVRSVMQTLENEAVTENRLESFQKLRPLMLGGANFEIETEIPSPEPKPLEGSMRIALHRLRKRFRKLIRERIANTLESPADPAEIEDEIGYLINSLLGGGDENERRAYL